MNNARIEVRTAMPFQVGAYGYEVRFECFDFELDSDPTTVTTLVIQRVDGSIINKTATLIDGEEGIVSYTIEEDVFTIPGTYNIQIKQVRMVSSSSSSSQVINFLSPEVLIPVYPSITSSSSSS